MNVTINNKLEKMRKHLNLINNDIDDIGDYLKDHVNDFNIQEQRKIKKILYEGNVSIINCVNMIDDCIGEEEIFVYLK